MIILLTILHVLVCVFLILVVLLQTGKGADLGAFMGGGSQTAFGARGATTLLHKLTTASAVVFMITSFVLAVFASRQPGSVVQDPGTGTAAPAPAVPGEPADLTPAPVPTPDEAGDAEEAESTPSTETGGGGAQ